MEVNDIIGRRIREIRQKRGLNQQDMADKLNLSQSAYAKIENGHTTLDVNRLLVLSEFLEVPISDFLPSQKGTMFQFNSKDGYQVEHFYADGRQLLKDRDRQISHLEKEVLFLRNLIEKK